MFPPKLRARPCQVGSADPPVPPLATAFLRYTAWWVLMSDGRCRGFVRQFSLSKIAHFVGETRDRIFRVFFSMFTSVFLIFHQWMPADHNSQKLMELVKIKPYN